MKSADTYSGLLPHTILRAASLLAPANGRGEWVKEWESELWYVPRREATRFCLGAFQDALSLRRDERPAKRTGTHLESPLSCLAFLAMLAAASMAIVLRLPLPQLEQSSHFAVRDLPRACVTMLLFSCLFLPGTLAVWGRPANYHSMPWPRRLRRGIFLAMKIALVQPMVVCLLFVVLIVPGAVAGFYPAVILVLRWVITDQQRRCPVCLRLLTAPIHIGTPSRTFLEWYGAESACSHGHGLLHISENTFSYSRKPQWLSLDDSWRDLFAEGVKRDA
jgi:hypothetical protein